MFFKKKQKPNPFKLILTTLPTNFVLLSGDLIRKFKLYYQIGGIEDPSDTVVAAGLVVLRDNGYIELEEITSQTYKIRKIIIDG